MTSILQIDTIGKRYGMLPSEVLRRADSFDLYIMDCALTFERHHQSKDSKGLSPVPDLTQEELMKIKDS
tara:strand:+ start:197 stop:403 length:207 start_codon:yes stop_codon:yes gene_type:complete